MNTDAKQASSAVTVLQIVLSYIEQTEDGRKMIGDADLLRFMGLTTAH